MSLYGLDGFKLKVLDYDATSHRENFYRKKTVQQKQQQEQ